MGPNATTSIFAAPEKPGQGAALRLTFILDLAPARSGGKLGDCVAGGWGDVCGRRLLFLFLFSCRFVFRGGLHGRVARPSSDLVAAGLPADCCDLTTMRGARCLARKLHLTASNEIYRTISELTANESCLAAGAVKCSRHGFASDRDHPRRHLSAEVGRGHAARFFDFFRMNGILCGWGARHRVDKYCAKRTALRTSGGGLASA